MKICGSAIFKNAVWSLYILFIHGLASLKESMQAHLPIASSRQINFCCWSETKRKPYRPLSALRDFTSRWLFFFAWRQQRKVIRGLYMIFHLVHSHNGQREKVKTTLTVIMQKNGHYCKKINITFLSSMITHSLPRNLIINPVNLLW